MLNRRSILGLAAGAAALAVVSGSQLMGSAAPAVAGELVTYDAAAFAAAQAAGKPILVEIGASWCPTCRAQKPIIQSLAAQPKFADLVVFEVDFDSMKPVVRELGARSQATLIAYKGASEVGRSAFDTNAASIEAMLEQAL